MQIFLRIKNKKPLSKERAEVNDKFNEGLSVISTDEKVVIHGYRSIDDKKFSEFLSFDFGFFDTVVLAQSSAAGTTLLTEDSKLLNLKDIDIEIIRWRDSISLSHS